MASLGLAGYYYFNDNFTLTLSFLIITGFLPLMESFGIYNSVLNGRKLFNIQVQYSTLIHLFSIAAIIIVLFLTQNLFLILLAYFFSYTLWRFVFLTLTFKKIPLNKKEDPGAISYGKHLTFINILGVLASYLDKILVFHYLGGVQLAVYSFAITPPEQLKSFLKNVGVLAFPKLSVRTEAEIKATIFSKMLRFGLFIAAGIVIYIFLAPAFYRFFFPQYSESIFYSQIFSISLITAVTILPHAALEAKAAAKQLYQLNILSPLIQIGLLFLFIYSYGIMGVILARVVGRFVNSAITYGLVKKI